MSNPFEDINRRFDEIEYLLRQVLNQRSGEKGLESENPIEIEEVAKILNISVGAVYQNKSIPHHKRNNRLRFFRSEILNYLKNPTPTPETQTPFIPKRRKRK